MNDKDRFVIADEAGPGTILGEILNTDFGSYRLAARISSEHSGVVGSQIWWAIAREDKEPEIGDWVRVIGKSDISSSEENNQ